MQVFKPVNRVGRGLHRVLSSLNSDGRYGMALLASCALLLLPELAGDSGRMALRYERAAIGAGQLWRLLTAHIVHLDLDHAALNSLGLVLMWALFARDYRPLQWLAIVLGAIAAIDSGLWLRDSTVAWYVGSSGALHGVMAAGTLAHLRRGDLDFRIVVFRHKIIDSARDGGDCLKKRENGGQHQRCHPLLRAR